MDKGRPARLSDIWRVLLPIVPWALLSLVLSLILRRWGYGWVPWVVLGVLIVVALVLENVRAHKH
jgi:hypothetical protein